MEWLTPDRVSDLYSSFQLLVLAGIRPFGVAVLFTAFAWGQMNSGVMRIAFALVLALPVMAPLWTVARPTLAELPLPVVMMVGKEFLLGCIIGFLLCLPFEALNVAGAIVDNVRGSGAPLAGPAGELTPYAQVFTVIGLWLFASLGGFWLLTDVIYASYGTWPLLAPLPALTTEGAWAFVDFLTRLARLAVVIAAPLVALLLAVDLVFAVAGKIGKQLNVTFLTVSVKSLVALVALPLFAMVLVRVVTGEVLGLSALGKLAEAAIR